MKPFAQLSFPVFITLAMCAIVDRTRRGLGFDRPISDGEIPNPT